MMMTMLIMMMTVQVDVPCMDAIRIANQALEWIPENFRRNLGDQDIGI